MAMVDVVSGSLNRRTHSLSRLAWRLVLGRRQLGAILHSPNEPGELSQWPCHNDSTINIVLVIIIIICSWSSTLRHILPLSVRSSYLSLNYRLYTYDTQLPIFTVALIQFYTVPNFGSLH